MVQIPVGGGEFGKVSLLKGSAVQLSESAQFRNGSPAKPCGKKLTPIGSKGYETVSSNIAWIKGELFMEGDK